MDEEAELRYQLLLVPTVSATVAPMGYSSLGYSRKLFDAGCVGQVAIGRALQEVIEVEEEAEQKVREEAERARAAAEARRQVNLFMMNTRAQ